MWCSCQTQSRPASAKCRGAHTSRPGFTTLQPAQIYEILIILFCDYKANQTTVFGNTNMSPILVFKFPHLLIKAIQGIKRKFNLECISTPALHKHFRKNTFYN